MLITQRQIRAAFWEAHPDQGPFASYPDGKGGRAYLRNRRTRHEYPRGNRFGARGDARSAAQAEFNDLVEECFSDFLR